MNVIMITLLVIGLMASVIEALSDYYVWISVYVIIVAMLPFYIKLERKPLHSREMVLIASMAALAAVSRVPFASIPSVTPTSFVIIVSAIVFGADAGFLIGATAALVSNFMLGQGPWTPWQMFGWGMMGATAGWLRTSLLRTTLARIVFGCVWGFLFGWIMNIPYLFGFVSVVTWTSVLTVHMASFYFDLAHAISNVLFLLLFGKVWIRILQRYHRKYEDNTINHK